MPELSRAVAVATASLALLAPIACTRPLDEGECRKLLDRYTKFLAEEENPALVPAEIQRKQAEALALARRDPRFHFSACAKHVSRSSYECAMNASGVDAMERCLVF